jgi:endoglucanase
MNGLRYYGFNFQWMYSKERPVRDADEKALDFLCDLGLNFVRIPTDYRIWTKDTDYFHPDPVFIEKLFGYFKACEKRKIHFCLNIHRAPGYCINRNDLETHNLWTDTIAVDAFVFLWETLAIRFKGIAPDLVSFDLLNEPPEIGQYGMTREIHKEIMTKTAGAVWAIDPGRPIIVDGLAGGNLAMPELSDLPLIQSTRGYQPMALTHYKAQWCEATLAIKSAGYPGTEWEGKTWDKSVLAEHYKPWLDLQKKGVRVHVGELGCYNEVDNRDALRWYSDLLGLFGEWKWGYSLWDFEGPFGVVDHGRPGTHYSEYNGYKVDKELLDLILANRVVE